MSAAKEIAAQTGLDAITWERGVLAALATAGLAWGQWALLVPLGIAVVMNWEELDSGRLRFAGTGPDDQVGEVVS